MALRNGTWFGCCPVGPRVTRCLKTSHPAGTMSTPLSRTLKGETTSPTELPSSSEGSLTWSHGQLTSHYYAQHSEEHTKSRPAEQGLRTAAPSGRTVEQACIYDTPAASSRVIPQIKIHRMRMTQNYCHWSDPPSRVCAPSNGSSVLSATAAPRSASLLYPNTFDLRHLDSFQMHLILVTCP
jgi:hypothetical protein